jgi:hypothetical protein
MEYHKCHQNIYYHLPIPLHIGICDHLKPYFQNSKTTFHVVLCTLLTFCKMLFRRCFVAFEKCYLGDFPFARTWVLPSCTLFSPLFWVFCFLDVRQVFLFEKLLNKLLWIIFLTVLSLLIVIFGSVLLSSCY